MGVIYSSRAKISDVKAKIIQHLKSTSSFKSSSSELDVKMTCSAITNQCLHRSTENVRPPISCLSWKKTKTVWFHDGGPPIKPVELADLFFIGTVYLLQYVSAAEILTWFNSSLFAVHKSDSPENQNQGHCKKLIPSFRLQLTSLRLELTQVGSSATSDALRYYLARQVSS